MHANKREEIEEVWAGDIAAAVGLKDTTTGDTLCDDDHPVLLESIEFPEPVIAVAIEPKTKSDQEKLGVSLQKLATEDPSFRVQRRSGDRTDDDLRAWASCTSRSSSTGCCASSRSTPTSASRRSRTGRRSGAKVEKQAKFVRQTGGRGQYGDV